MCNCRIISVCLIFYVFFTDGKILDDIIIDTATSTLTRTQAEAVKKRVEKVNATLRYKQEEESRIPDVRDIFPSSQEVRLDCFSSQLLLMNNNENKNTGPKLRYRQVVEKLGRAWTAWSHSLSSGSPNPVQYSTCQST